MRLLHTADWQLGLRAAQVGERAAEGRAERLRALERTVALAHRLEVDLVLAAGDLFDHHEVSESLLREALGLLERLAPIRVALLPGNHDPLVEGGVWSRRAWRDVGSHIAVLDRAEEIEILPGVALYPCPLRQKRSVQDPTAWIPVRRKDDRRLRLGVAHGALDSLQVESNFPIARDRAELCGLDYLALGDWHGVLIQDRSCYPGTFEQSAFDERLPGYVLLVELDQESDPKRRQPPRVEQHRVGRLRWQQLEVEVRDLTDVERLRAEISTLGSPADLLLRVWLRAEGLDETARRALDRLEEELERSVLFLEWRVDQLGLQAWSPEDGGLGVLADVDRTLASLVAGEKPSPELEALLGDADVELLREARLSLRRLAARREVPAG
ncbi:MAG TPA: DNA repair exonuclease [Thermoanaerobaculia bacterium]|nr:DNA repair exonuclease [Thermoanaerobaculia bacterium]